MKIAVRMIRRLLPRRRALFAQQSAPFAGSAPAVGPPGGAVLYAKPSAQGRRFAALFFIHPQHATRSDCEAMVDSSQYVFAAKSVLREPCTVIC